MCIQVTYLQFWGKKTYILRSDLKDVLKLNYLSSLLKLRYLISSVSDVRGLIAPVKHTCP